MNWMDLFALWRLIEETNSALHRDDWRAASFQDNANFGTQLEYVCLKLSSETDMRGGTRNLAKTH